MDFYYLKRSLLFQGCTEEQINMMLTCFDAKMRSYQKNEIIRPAGRNVTTIGLILEGNVRVQHTDPWGNVSIVTFAEVGKTIGEAYACAPSRPLMVDIVANTDCTIVFMNAHKMMHRCPKRCECHLRVSTNLTELIAVRNLELARHGYIATKKSTRQKVIAYLSLMATERGSLEFDIPYNREQLTSYLGVDRSALSAELSRMKKAGIIDYRKNHFILNEQGEVI
ncbi:MAG: Crp/Fnr family transcriptional regulator [Coriobacteriia bacterium]|nr:Crp/Fnr family transcriptional regulator [Coriobacteriia bacterium]